MHSINFSASGRRFFLSLHYNGAINRHLFVNGTEVIKFKAKDFELTSTILCLGNISNDFSVSNMKKQDYMELFMSLVLIMVLFQLIIY